MNQENALFFVILIIYGLFLAIIALVALVPPLLNAIGLARVCKKLGAFRPVWCWVWAFLLSPVAVLRAGDVTAKKARPDSRPMLTHGLIATGVYIVLMTVCMLFMALFAVFTALELPEAWQSVFLIAAFGTAMIGLLAAVWMAVPLYISYYRIFSAFMPTWGAVILLVGMVVFSEFSFLVMPVLSFLPVRKD